MPNRSALSFLTILIALSVSVSSVPSSIVSSLSGQEPVATAPDDARRWPEFAHKTFRFQPAKGIGREKDVTRRDVSDVQVPPRTE